MQSLRIKFVNTGVKTIHAMNTNKRNGDIPGEIDNPSIFGECSNINELVLTILRQPYYDSLIRIAS